MATYALVELKVRRAAAAALYWTMVEISLSLGLRREMKIKKKK
jgi:hypothetical protein